MSPPRRLASRIFSGNPVFANRVGNGNFTGTARGDTTRSRHHHERGTRCHHAGCAALDERSRHFPSIVYPCDVDGARVVFLASPRLSESLLCSWLQKGGRDGPPWSWPRSQRCHSLRQKSSAMAFWGRHWCWVVTSLLCGLSMSGGFTARGAVTFLR